MELSVISIYLFNCDELFEDDALALWVERRTNDREIAGSTPARAQLRKNSRQVFRTVAPLSPSSISWYRCENREGNGRLCKRCGLLSLSLIHI